MNANLEAADDQAEGGGGLLEKDVVCFIEPSHRLEGID